MDTTVQHIVIDTLSLDSLSYKISTLQEAVNKHPAHTLSIWIPLLSALMGGCLVLAGQFIDRNYKRKQDRLNNLREIYSYCRKLEALMRNHYRELAMTKVHVEYWWYCNRISLGSEKQLFYDEHLKSQSAAREVERRIGEAKADFIGHVRKFQAIRPLPDLIEDQLLEISDLTNLKAKMYDTATPHDDVRFAIAEKDEKELREVYFQNLKNFKSINEYLQAHLF